MSTTKWFAELTEDATADEATVDFTWREPPKLKLPKMPAGFTATPSGDLRGHRPMKAEISAAQRAVKEVAAMSDWESLFGVTAPPAALFVERVGRALRWSAFLAEVLPLALFAKSRTGDAWREALQVIDDLKLPFDLAAKANPARVESLPGLRALLRAQRDVAKRAVASRLRKLAETIAPSQGESHNQEDR